jgi:UDP-glucose 4-epimerase
MNILVVGGAGYIASHLVKFLGDADYRIAFCDNLSIGFSDSVVQRALIKGDIADRDKIQAVLHERQIEAVFHFASSIQVGESTMDPVKYYRNNLVNTLNLLDAMRAGALNVWCFHLQRRFMVNQGRCQSLKWPAS